MRRPLLWIRSMNELAGIVGGPSGRMLAVGSHAGTVVAGPGAVVAGGTVVDAGPDSVSTPAMRWVPEQAATARATATTRARRRGLLLIGTNGTCLPVLADPKYGFSPPAHLRRNCL